MTNFSRRELEITLLLLSGQNRKRNISIIKPSSYPLLAPIKHVCLKNYMLLIYSNSKNWQQPYNLLKSTAASSIQALQCITQNDTMSFIKKLANTGIAYSSTSTVTNEIF